MAEKEDKEQIPGWVHSGSMEQVDPDEKLVAVIKRHPFGIIILYIEVAIAIAAAIGLVAFLLPSFTSDGAAFWWLRVISFAIIGLLLAVLVVATIVYRQSQLILTDKSLTDVLQEGLINRQVSQLALSDIEDVTAHRRGIFPTILNFGVLNIETAGERENFDFVYCPNPDHYAKLILEGRQHFIESKTE